ncbi:MAG: hypothetical protein ABJE95_07470 [Byssovorax sp.]
MMAWMRAEPNEDAIADEEAGQRAPVKGEPNATLEDAVQRAMNDLEQEIGANGDTDRSQQSAS